jgi:hypothetical protein
LAERGKPEWLLDNVPMNKTVLRKFLKAGFMEDGKHHATELGTPQVRCRRTIEAAKAA